MISEDGISKQSQSDGPSICANERSVPETLSSIETSHEPEEPFAKSPRFSPGVAEFRPGDLAVVPPPSTRNTIRIEPRTTLKSTDKEMKTDGKLPVSQGHKRVSPLRVGPAPVLSSLATGNSIVFP